MCYFHQSPVFISPLYYAVLKKCTLKCSHNFVTCCSLSELHYTRRKGFKITSLWSPETKKLSTADSNCSAHCAVITCFPVTVECGGKGLKLTDRLGASDDNRIDVTIEQGERYVCVYEQCAVTVIMFCSEALLLFCDSSTQCEIEVDSLAQCNSCMFTVTTGRHWPLQVVPFGVCTRVTSLLTLLSAYLELNLHESSHHDDPRNIKFSLEFFMN